MNDRFLTFEEERILAPPLRLVRGALFCDVESCHEFAVSLVRGAALCEGCGRRYGIEGGGVYLVPVDELDCDVEARINWYETMLRERRKRLLVPATPEKERLLAGLVRDRIDEFIRSAGAQP